MFGVMECSVFMSLEYLEIDIVRYSPSGVQHRNIRVGGPGIEVENDRGQVLQIPVTSMEDLLGRFKDLVAEELSPCSRIIMHIEDAQRTVSSASEILRLVDYASIMSAVSHMSRPTRITIIGYRGRRPHVPLPRGHILMHRVGIKRRYIRDYEVGRKIISRIGGSERVVVIGLRTVEDRYRVFVVARHGRRRLTIKLKRPLRLETFYALASSIIARVDGLKWYEVATA